MRYGKIIMACMIVASTARAQSDFTPDPDSNPGFAIKKEGRFSLNVHGGYSLALGSTFAFYPDDIAEIHASSVNGTITSKTTRYKAPTKGLGEGFHAGAGISYILNDFLNVGLDFDYFRSTIEKTKDSTSQQTFTGTGMTQSDYRQRNVISYDAILLTFTPNITFKAISRPKWFIYNKVGAVVVVRPNSIEHDKTDVNSRSMWTGGYAKDSSSHSDLRYDWGIRNPSLGFMGGIGIQVHVLSQVRVFSEIQFSHVVFQIRDRKVNSYNVDGKDMVQTLPMSQRQVLFKKDFETTALNANPDQPSEAAVQRLPITYVGINFGVVYRF